MKGTAHKEVLHLRKQESREYLLVYECRERGQLTSSQLAYVSADATEHTECESQQYTCAGAQTETVRYGRRLTAQSCTTRCCSRAWVTCYSAETGTDCSYLL